VQVCPDVFAIGGNKVASVIDSDQTTTRQACAAEAAEVRPQLVIAEIDE